MGTNTAEFTEQNFNSDVLESDKPVLVDFWAEWCGPCKMLAPAIDSIAEKYIGRVKVGKVNVDKYPSIAQKYGVMGIPNILVFQNGNIKEQVIGNVPESDISNILDKLI